MTSTNFESISRGLYSQRLRFLYELLQNADDANYSRTQSLGREPAVRLILNPTELIFEINEDGFKAANVCAICSTGRSSKKLSDDDRSIGEKGYGFKSVFNVANWVHIQSGIWSFRFEYQDGDGLSMIRPIYTEIAADLPRNVQTRIRLRYKESHRDTLMHELENLPASSIMFLQKIKKITIKLNHDNSSLRSRELFNNSDEYSGDPRRITSLNVTTIPRNGTEKTKQELYRKCFSYKSDMPSDSRRNNHESVETVLALPLESLDGLPSVSQQGNYLFAFLPMARHKWLPVSNETTFGRSGTDLYSLRCNPILLLPPVEKRLLIANGTPLCGTTLHTPSLTQSSLCAEMTVPSVTIGSVIYPLNQQMELFGLHSTLKFSAWLRRAMSWKARSKIA